MKQVIAAALLTGLIITGCEPAKQSEPAKSPPTSNTTGNPITAPVDYLGAVAKAKKASEKTIDLVALNQAIQLFNVQEERLPKDLQELVTKKYIAALPPPPAGMKFDYNTKTGELKISAK